MYLHEVLDKWFEIDVKPRLQGRAELVRYADDFVILFKHEADARGVLEVLKKRLGRFGLQVHPDKTRLVPFDQPRDRGDDPGTFDFLGFTHHWGLSRRGQWVVKRRTARSRFTRGLRATRQWCRRHRHLPLREQQTMLRLKLLGHYNYYGITGNSTSLSRYWREVRGIWRTWLSRRSRKAYLSWDCFYRLLMRYPLPPPRAVHSIYRAASP